MRAFVTAVAAGIVVAAVAGVATGIPAAGAATVPAVAVSSATKSATLGDRVSVTVKLAAPRRARTVQLQTLTRDAYGSAIWSRIATQRVSRNAKYIFKPVLNQANRERFRAVARYKTGKRVVSNSVGGTVWSGTPLSKFSAYYATNGDLLVQAGMAAVGGFQSG